MQEWKPSDAQYDNPYEDKILSYCKRYLTDQGFRFYPKSTKYAPDIRVYDKDNKTFICHIEVEAKKQEFTEHPNPPGYWTDWSFLGRKVRDSIQFHNKDLYCLCDQTGSDNIFALNFGLIRHHANVLIRQANNREEIYYRIPIHTINVWTQWEQIGKYLNAVRKYLLNGHLDI